MTFKSRFILTLSQCTQLGMSKVDIVTDIGPSGNGGGGLAPCCCGPLCPETRCPWSPDLVLTQQVICSFIKSKSLPHVPPGGPGGKLIGLFVAVILFNAAIKVRSQTTDRKQLCCNGCKDTLSALTSAWFQSQSDHLMLCYWRNAMLGTCLCKRVFNFQVSSYYIYYYIYLQNYDLFYCIIVLFLVCELMMKILCLCWTGLLLVFLCTLALTAAGHLSRVKSSSRTEKAETEIL